MIANRLRVSHDRRECKETLATTTMPVVIDVETTGLRRWDTLVSVGVLVNGVAFIFFVGTLDCSIRRVPLGKIHLALAPLAQRQDLVVVGHNIGFDLGMLLRAGISVAGAVRDTEKILRLLDADRGSDRGERRVARIDRRSPRGSRILLNYKLKDVARQLLGLRLPHFPGAIEAADYVTHARYLACDLWGTQQLYDHLWPQLNHDQRSYYAQLVAPLTPLLVQMGEAGVVPDPDFIRSESDRLVTIMKDLSERHGQRHGRALGMDAAELAGWLFGRNGLALEPRKWKRRGFRWVPSLDGKALERLLVQAGLRSLNSAADSIRIIRAYRQAASLLMRLRAVGGYIDPVTCRIHTSLNDRQATGRVSSARPNLQQLANTKVIEGKQIVTRNAVRATRGHVLVAFDVKQADMRILAHMVDSFPQDSEAYLRDLQDQRLDALHNEIWPYYQHLATCRNSDYQVELEEPPVFEPGAVSNLVSDFHSPDDFYSLAVGRVLKRPPKDKAERNYFKRLVLAIVNGQGPPSLAEALKCSEKQAADYLAAFDKAYPKEAAYRDMMYRHIALAGKTSTFAGRTRAVTPQRWMVTEPRVEILVSYRRSDKYWVEVVPLRMSFRVLTTFVLRAWDARQQPRRLIYHHERGQLSAHDYRMFDTADLLYRLPCRNWSWRNIRRVRVRRLGEEAKYYGMYTTVRALFNFIAQGGTADMTKGMMLRSQPICRTFDARLLLQIHDELVFEVPRANHMAFITAVKPVLEEPPIPGFRVPVCVDVECGEQFGSLEEISPVSLAQ